jgi:hypothetical protein
MQYFVISLNKEIMNLKYSVGLDIASKKIDICMSVIDSNQRVIVVFKQVIFKHFKWI